MKVLKAIALKGGASKGLAYLNLFREMENKSIDSLNVSGTSAGSLFGSMFACNYTAYEMKEILKSLKLDKSMIQFSKIEKDIREKKGGFFRMAFLFPLIKIFFSHDIQSKLKKYLSWNRIGNKNLFVCGVLKKALYGFCGKDFFDNGLGNLDSIKHDPCSKIVYKIPPIYFTSSGVYAGMEDRGIMKMTKVSDDIIPLHKAVYISVWNFFMSSNRIKIKFYDWFKKQYNLAGDHHDFFDGGVIDNYSGSIVFRNIDYIQFSPMEFPKKTLVDFGLENVPDYLYNLNRGKKEYQVPYNGDMGFFSFNDENIEKVWSLGATNFFENLND